MEQLCRVALLRALLRAKAITPEEYNVLLRG